MAGSNLRLIVLARDRQPKIADAWTRVEQMLSGRDGLELIAAGVIEEINPPEQAADLVVTLGGDGAILRACRWMGRNQRPVLGINLGRLGFLADLSLDEFEESLSDLRGRNFRVVEHLMFECEIRNADGTTETHLGLNEVVISSAASMAMLELELTIDDEDVTTYSGDGLIVSTPIGSTAHSLSAGGPILRQDLQAFVITPICPHTLTNRPLVDRADRVYRMQVPNAPDGVMLVVDGQIRRPLSGGDVVTVRKADVTFQLAKVPGHTYYSTLHRKLGWGGQPRYQKPAEEV